MSDTIPATADVRWRDKAQAFHEGWLSVFGTPPSLHAVVLGLCVAQHETRCGDAWPGEHNWGACQKRRLTPEEKAAVVGIVCGPKTVEQARVALREAGLPPDQEALHVDSSPGKGWYWVYFWAFPDDVGGAALFVKVIARQRPGCRVILDGAGGPMELAGAMYRSGYYEGFHDPKAPGGKEQNIADYGGSLARLEPGIRGVLSGWQGHAPIPPEAPEWVATEEDRQQQLSLFIMPTLERGGGPADPLDHLHVDDMTPTA